MKRPLRIGLTGGIASGKSTVSGLFAALGVPVIDTDQIARDVVAAGTPLLARLITRFGAELLTPHGELDRRALRERVFADPADRAALEALMHPAIMAELRRRVDAAGGAYQILAMPLLVEHNLRCRRRSGAGGGLRRGAAIAAGAGPRRRDAGPGAGRAGRAGLPGHAPGGRG